MPAIAGQWLPSATSQSMLACQVSDFSDVLDVRVGFGIAAASPGTFGALASSGYVYAPNNAQVTMTRMPGIGTVSFLDVRGSFGAAGQLAWLCLFALNPVGGSVPLAVAGPFTIGP